MRKLLLAVAAVAVMAIPAVSNAQLQLGARLGYGFAMGEAEAGFNQSDWVSGQIPFEIDLNYKFMKNLSVGAYFSYAYGMVGGTTKDACDAFNLDCSASGMRLGVQLAYDFSPGASFDPWVGLGFGYEWATVSMDIVDVTATGLEFASLQVGADWAMAKGFGLGPFVSWSFGQYGSADDGTGSVDIVNKGTHQLVQIGVRGLFSF
ncbi:MAG TPA: outer membrane beta-barrel protein [Anaeromyxobacteraceae bacterium]|nr:outer membrane beta-barrel protein [Anaeromyxobacteraceae bacterium]